ncbi:hypothetical protein KY325_00290 [Candidatus Woesearchaeota archaeon]|nr:hypothetical protein [Candidatus Woesearchaeota archaeon]
MDIRFAIIAVIVIVGMLMLSLTGSEYTGKGVALKISPEIMKKLTEEKKIQEIPPEVLKKVAKKVETQEPSKDYACYDSEFLCKIATNEMSYDKNLGGFSVGLSIFDCALIKEITDLRKELNKPTDTSSLNMFTNLCKGHGW